MWNVKAALALAILSFPLVPLAQFIASLPGCIQNCIQQSPDTNCGLTDIECLCKASAGNFLTDTVICIKRKCDNDLDPDILLTPIQFACQLAGAPIPESAIQSAEGAASTAVATTMSHTPASSSSGATNTGVVTVTMTQGGSTVTIAYPVTEWRTTTVSGVGSTITSVSISSSVSTYTTTDSIGQTTTMETTNIETSTQGSSSSDSSTSGSSESTTFITTTVAAQATSSGVSSAKTTTTASGDSDASDSAPFKDSNSAVREGVGIWLGMSALVVMGMMLL